MIRVLVILLLLCVPTQARDLGQWENTDPATREWFKNLMQPDVPNASCCGEADAYWCDDLHFREGKSYCIISDDRDDKLLNRMHVDIGTEIEVPERKLKYDKGNPTGHGVVFMSRALYVFCYVQGSGA